MARSIKEIYNTIIKKKQEVADLNFLTDEKDIREALKDMDLGEDSKVGIWRLIAYTVAVCTYWHEQIFDFHKEEVQSIVNSAQVHTSEWYAEKVLQYQHGDALLLHSESKQPYYEVVDTQKCIVKSVAVTGKGFALIKCKGQSSALLEDERLGVESYIRQIQEPGAQISVISLPSDKLRIHANLFYKAEQDRNTVEQAVQTVVSSFIQNLEFNGELLRNDLIDAVRQVTGVADFYITVFMARSDSGVFAEVEDRYYSTSGWLELEDYNITSISDV